MTPGPHGRRHKAPRRTRSLNSSPDQQDNNHDFRCLLCIKIWTNCIQRPKTPSPTRPKSSPAPQVHPAHSTFQAHHLPPLGKDDCSSFPWSRSTGGWRAILCRTQEALCCSSTRSWKNTTLGTSRTGLGHRDVLSSGRHLQIRGYLDQSG